VETSAESSPTGCGAGHLEECRIGLARLESRPVRVFSPRFLAYKMDSDACLHMRVSVKRERARYVIGHFAGRQVDPVDPEAGRFTKRTTHRRGTNVNTPIGRHIRREMLYYRESRRCVRNDRDEQAKEAGCG
jgi:hypothetical protein